jgi:hypothetical protein
MAIHAPAHRPTVHFHLAMPHAGGWVNDILTVTATGVVALAIALALSAVLTEAGYLSGTRALGEPYRSAVSPVAYDGSAAMAALAIRSQPLTEAQGLVQYRAGEREPLTVEARSAAMFRAGERAPLFSEADSLVIFRAGERAPAPTEAESLVIFRAGERISR